MSEDIVLEITEVVNQQKKSKAKRFKVAVLVIGVLLLATLTVAAYFDLPTQLFLISIAVVIVVTIFSYSYPSRQEKKFMKTYVGNLDVELASRGYKFADSKLKSGYKPWFSSQSAYLYGDGLVLRRSLNKGLKARQLKFVHSGEKRTLSVERLISKQNTLIRVVPTDGKPMEPKRSPSGMPILPSKGLSIPPQLVVPSAVKEPDMDAHGGAGNEGPSAFVAWEKDTLT